MATKYTIEDMKKIALKKGGKCLSSKYQSVNKHLKWECRIGHQWNAIPNNILRGKWCPECAGNTKIKWDWFKNHVESKNGKLLSLQKEYKNNSSKLKIECSEHGLFEISVADLRANKWCRFCGYKTSAAKQKSNNGLEDARELARSHNGECLSSNYENYHSKLLFKCQIPTHPAFELSLAKLAGERWCPVCGIERRTRSLTANFDHYLSMAKKEDYKILSEEAEFKKSTSKLQFKCPIKEHPPFEVSCNEFQQGARCPYCGLFRLENICRAYFETLFGVKFKKVRPEWLKFGDNKAYELDGYNKDLKVAFEHNGRQHYEVDGYFNKTKKDLSDLKTRDRKKRTECKKRGIALFEIPELGHMLKVDSLKEFILEQAKKHGRFESLITKNYNKKVGTLNGHRSQYFEKLKNIVKGKKGKIISEFYLGAHEKMTFECYKGHLWDTTPAHVVGNKARKGTWCPICNPNKNQFSRIGKK